MKNSRKSTEEHIDEKINPSSTKETKNAFI